MKGGYKDYHCPNCGKDFSIIETGEFYVACPCGHVFKDTRVEDLK